MAADTVDLGKDTGTGLAGQSTYKKISSLNVYDFMDMTREGSGIYRDGTGLVPHTREMDYPKRKEIAFYKNFVKPIVRAMVEPVFTDEAVRKVEDIDGNEQTGMMVNTFIEDADNDGSSLQSVVEDIVTYSRLHGVSFAVVDNFPSEDIKETTQANIDARIMPYVYMRKAQQVKGWKLDRFGKLEVIAFYESAPGKGLDSKDIEGIAPTKKDKENEGAEYIRIWDTEKSQVYRKTKKESKFKKDGDPVLHGLGRIPVLTLFAIRRKDKTILLVDPPLYDLARLNYTVFNKDSEIRELERAQGFSFLYAQGIEPGDLTIGANNYLNIPEGATIAPGYCAPDPNIQKTLMENNGNIKDDIFTIAEQNGVTGITDQSGIAKQWDFFAHESVLKKTSSMAVDIEERIIELFKGYTGEVFVYTVEYKTDFQPNDALKEIEQYERYLDLQPVSLGRALAMGAVARLVFRDQAQEKVKAIADQEEREANDEKKSKEKDNTVPDNLNPDDE